MTPLHLALALMAPLALWQFSLVDLAVRQAIEADRRK